MNLLGIQLLQLDEAQVTENLHFKRLGKKF